MLRNGGPSEGKRFAVIADEAHSSQTGEAASKLKQVLSAEEIEARQDGGGGSREDILRGEVGAGAGEAGIPSGAFTGPPKAKRLDLLGRRPKPDQPAAPDNLPQPFHVY